MSAERTRSFVQRYLDAINGRDKTPELLRQYVADEGLIEHIATIEAAFPRYRLEPQDVIVEGDKAVVRFQFQATHSGEFFGMPPTGRKVSAGGIIIYRVENEKVVDHWLQFDAPAVMQQLSAEAPAGVA
jgi:predicted ester cyclase